MNIALTVAGSDSGGGAGLEADLKTFHQFGVFGTCVVTAVTAQNTRAVLAWEPVAATLVARQLEAVAVDLPPLATKSGMLGTGEVVDAVAWGLKRYEVPHYVLDPVLVASTGQRLLEREAEQLVLRKLLPLAALVVPNLDEAEVLTEDEVRTVEQMERAGRALVKLGAAAAFVTGGHLDGPELTDVLVTEGAVRRLVHPRLDTTSTHGTGCTLSAALAAGLAQGRDLPQAAADAVDFVVRAIAAAPGLGGGRGPLNHFVPARPAAGHR